MPEIEPHTAEQASWTSPASPILVYSTHMGVNSVFLLITVFHGVRSARCKDSKMLVTPGVLSHHLLNSAPFGRSGSGSGRALAFLAHSICTTTKLGYLNKLAPRAFPSRL